MFLHGSWDHILGNMLFLAVFGKNVEDAFGHLRYLVFYFAGGFVGDADRRRLSRCSFGNGADARVPNLGASGAIAAVLGAYFVLYPNSRVLRARRRLLRSGSRPGSSSASGSSTSCSRRTSGCSTPSANGGGVAFFAHVGGFVFGVLVTVLLRGRLAPANAGGVPIQQPI